MRSHRRNLLLASLTMYAVAACGGSHGLDGETVDSAAPSVVGDGALAADGDEAADDASPDVAAVDDAAKAFGPEAFRKAANCSDCIVSHYARLSLPETGVLAASAKLYPPTGGMRNVTIDGDGNVLDEGALLAAERATAQAKYGNLRPELAQWLATASDEEQKWVWIWAELPPSVEPRREELVADVAAHAAHEAKLAELTETAVAPIRSWLTKFAPDAALGDPSGPMIRARLTARQIRQLKTEPNIGAIGTDGYPGQRDSAPWSTTSQWGATLRIAAAQALGTGYGRRVCVEEDTQPDDYSHLTVTAVASSTGSTSSHTRATTGIIRNTDSSPYTSVAPSALIYVGDSSNFTATGGIDTWCKSNSTTVLSYSYDVAGTSNTGGLTGTDMSHDYLAKQSPYMLVVSAAGTPSILANTDYVRNRGYNGLVVGAMQDLNTADRSDDQFSTSASAWRNPASAHNDIELPHVVAIDGATSAGANVSGTSGATAMVAGIGALIESIDTNMSIWPEERRAVIIATATGRGTVGAFNKLPAGDTYIGAGLVDAYQAADLAQPSNAVSSNGNVIAAKGRLGRTVTFASDFGSDGYLTAKWKAHASTNGRMRIVIAWDATATCSNGSCSGDTLDGDLDLHIANKTGDSTWTFNLSQQNCYSDTYDSSWETCDFPVTAGSDYLIAVSHGTTTATSTYMGLAWYLYQQPSGSACTASTECASGTCASGHCTCSSDSDCPDRYCASNQCTTKKTLGQSCALAHECVSGNCVDGVCCDSACSGTCQACSAAKKGTGGDGVCQPITLGNDPDSECPAQSCTGATLTYKQTCNGSGACASPSPATTACGNYACSGSSCATSCSSDAACSSSAYCRSGSCVPKLALGSPCAGANQCNAGFCVDGVCCDTACTASCVACNVSGSVGTCSIAPAGAPVGARTCAGYGTACGSACSGTSTSCVFTAAGSACSDSNVCNGSETCDGAGTCSAGTPPLAIDDGNACTVDSCDSTTGAITHTQTATGTCPPLWSAASLSYTQLSDTSVHLSWTAASHAAGITGYRIYQEGTLVASPTSTTYDLSGLAAGTMYRIKVEAVSGTGSASSDGPSAVVQTVVVPSWAPPPTSALDPSVSTDFSGATSFLYAGSGAPQTGVSAGTIVPAHASIIRGLVLDRSGIVVAGARVSVVGHPELGTTFTRTDGWYDLVVNGGGRLAVRIEKAGFVTVQRSTAVPWNDFAVISPVVLTPYDTKVTPIALGSSVAGWQKAESSVTNDGDSSTNRKATLLFPPGTTAKLQNADGSETDLTGSINVRATELTVGATGLAAMPGELPPTTAYTYAVSLDADEALTARGVRFPNGPVVLYVDNFLGTAFVPGETAPLGYYDRERAMWVPDASGLIVKIIGISASGVANLDITNDGVDAADSDATLKDAGISVDERRALAEGHAAGNVLIRVLVNHFSAWDINWGVAPPPSAVPPAPPPPIPDEPKPCKQKHSIIECENLVLGEEFPIAGTPLKLDYWSSRAFGRAANRTYEALVTGDTVPDALERVDVVWTVAGRVFHQRMEPSPSMSAKFTWDGVDVYGRKLEGRRPIYVKVGYVYKAQYKKTSAFGYYGNGTVITGVRSGGNSFPTTYDSAPVEGSPPAYSDELTLWTTQVGTVGNIDADGAGLGGFDLNVHHLFDPASNILFQGDGPRRAVDRTADLWMSHLTGPGARYDYWVSPAPLAKDVTFSNSGYNPGVVSVAIGPDGTTYFGDGADHRFAATSPTTGWVVGRIATDGKVYPVTTSLPGAPTALAVGPDGKVYVASGSQIFRIDGSTPVAIAGSATSSTSAGDGGPARNAFLTNATAIAFASDGSLFVIDLASSGGNLLRRIAQPPTGTDLGDGIISTVKGGLGGASSVAADADGNVYYASNDAFVGGGVYKLTPAGVTTRIAGAGGIGIEGDGGLAKNATVAPMWLAVAKDGTVIERDYSTSPPRSELRAISPDGIIRALTLTGWGSAAERDGSAWDGSTTSNRFVFALAPDGSLALVDGNVIWRIATSVHGAVVPGTSVTDLVVAGEDGRTAHVFDGAGRHQKTVDAYTGVALWSFGYDSSGRVASVTDVNGRTTKILRVGSTDPDAPSDDSHVVIVSPDRQKTRLTLDTTSKALLTVEDPIAVAGLPGQSWTLTWNAGELLSTLTDANGIHNFEWYADGSLKKDTDAAASSLTLQRVDDGAGWTTTVTDTLDYTTWYQQVFGVTDGTRKGLRKRILTRPDGTAVSSLIDAVENTDTTYPDGRLVSTATTPDPLWGRSAPLTNVTTTVPVSGSDSLKQTKSIASSVSYTSSGHPSSRTDTITVSGTGGDVTTTNEQVTLTSTFNSDATHTETLTSAAGRTRTSSFDATGHLTQIQVPGISPVSFTWENGRIKTVSQGTRMTTWNYGTDGFASSVVDAAGRTTSFDAHDLIGRVTQQTLPGAQTVAMTYDASGSVTSVTPPSRPAHTFSFTSGEQLDLYTAPAVTGSSVARVTDYDWDTTGVLTKITQPGGAALTFVRDPTTGRLATSGDSSAAGATLSYTYDPATGRLSSANRSIGTWSSVAVGYGYTGAMLSTETLSGDVAAKLTRAFDNLLRVASLTVQNADGSQTSEASFRYDADGLLTAVGPKATVGSSPVMSLIYDAPSTSKNGLLRELDVTSGGGTVKEVRSYNQYAELSSQSVTSGANTLLSISYEPTGYPRDALGRVVRKSETVAGVAHDYDYVYDPAGRLTQVSQDGVVVEHYEYAAPNGARSSVTKGGTTTSATYDEQDRIKTFGSLTYAFDDAGRLTSVSDGITTTTYVYDARGNLVRVVLPDSSAIDYVIDAYGRRVGKRVSGTLVRTWIYDGALRIVGEIDGAGTLTQYVYGLRPNVPEYAVRGGSVYRIITDALGSVRLVVNAATGATMQQMDYDAFGNVAATEYIASGWAVVPFGFAGGLYDRDAKLVRFGVRDYDAQTGRWTRVDPLRFAAGLSNLYAYVGNDPVNWHDPSGHFGFGVGGNGNAQVLNQGAEFGGGLYFEFPSWNPGSWSVSVYWSTGQGDAAGGTLIDGYLIPASVGITPQLTCVLSDESNFWGSAQEVGASVGPGSGAVQFTPNGQPYGFSVGGNFFPNAPSVEAHQYDTITHGYGLWHKSGVVGY